LTSAACFETYYGDHRSAIAQIHNGLTLVENSKPVVAERDSPLGLLGTSLSSYGIGDELMQALGRLDVRVMTFLDPRDKQTHNRMQYHGQAYLDSMAARFTCVKKARGYLELLMRRFMHLIALASSSQPTLEGIDVYLRHAKHRFILSPAQRACQARHVKDLERWHIAFQPLLQQARKSEKDSDFLSATALEIHYMASLYTLDSLTCQSTEAYTPLFADTDYKFDLNVITPLYLVGLKCEDSKVRKEAVALLLASPRREDVWDGILVGQILQWVISIEEEDSNISDDGSMTYDAVVDLDFQFNLQAKVVEVKCWQLKDNKESVERHTVIYW